MPGKTHPPLLNGKFVEKRSARISANLRLN